MTLQFQALRPKARLYITLVVLAGVFVIGSSVHQLIVNPISNRWLILAALTLLTGSFNVKVSSINAYISVSEAFVFASILLFGTPAGTATVVIECLVILLWMKREMRFLHRVLFNMAAPAVAVWTAGTAFYLLSGIEPYSRAFTPLPTLFLPLLAFTALYFLLNSWLVAIAVGLESGKSSAQIWLKNFAWLSVNYFSGASLAALIVTYTVDLDFSSLVVIVPLLVVSYLTFRTAMGRAEDSYTHLSELNRLYLSTIETLAMAIDAKDQVTHGHIRRVQAYAVGLAKQIGVSDEKLLKAIEAAALLHDMGKLAVPEHILNKPGKLTTAEFEKMKLHASFGADMLSAIDFPYPVVPIVRHHHENWDGTGYPTGIRGTDIPIGARILSVVDCFDALTSDRPYRARLSDEDAIAILLQRRGSMYDPLVVDTFIRVHKDIAPTEVIVVHEPSSTAKSPRLMSSADAATPTPAVVASVDPKAEAVEHRLRGSVSFALGIVFIYDAANDELIGQHVIGKHADAVRGLRIGLGDRLSGWVAANKKTIINSDPALDLTDRSGIFTPRLQAALSVPLLSEQGLVGVLALYSSGEPFTDDQRRFVEGSAQWLVSELTPSRDIRPVRPMDLTGLPDAAEIPAEVARLADADSTQTRSLLFIEILGMNEIRTKHSDAVVQRAVVQTVRTIKQALDGQHSLFRRAADELVALVCHSESDDVWALAKRLRDIVRAAPVTLDNGEQLTIHLSTHGMGVPQDQAALRDILALRHGVPVAASGGRKAPHVH